MQRLKELENSARQLEPDSTFRKEITYKATNYVNRFIESLPDSPGFTKGICDKLEKLSVGEKGKSFDELLGILETEVDAIGINSASGAHLGYIPGGGIWSGAIADLLAAATNRYAGIAFSSPGAVAIENQMIRWLCSIVGYPETAHGNLSSGGSVANLIAIQAARDFYNICSANVKKSVIYLTEHTHHCIGKALHTTGLSEAVIHKIPLNNRYQMNLQALREQLKQDCQQGLNPFLIIATAGTTDTGAIDPLKEIADLCQKNNIWLHVDAAYGGFFLLVDELRARFEGIERADSVVMDPHKTLFIPYGSGVVLVKDREALLASNTKKAAYMNDAYNMDEINPSDTGPELSKHFRGLRMWLPLHLHGLEPFRANLEEKWLLCAYFHQEIKKMGFETGPEPQLSITMFRYPGDHSGARTRQLLATLHEDGRFFFSSTTIDEKFWIRCAVVSFRTHLNEINRALQMIREAMNKTSD